VAERLLLWLLIAIDLNYDQLASPALCWLPDTSAQAPMLLAESCAG
jgi:hypothetical protein